MVNRISMGNRSATLAERDALVMALHAFAQWSHGPQPAGALVQHHGLTTTCSFFGGYITQVQGTDFGTGLLFIFHLNPYPTGRNFENSTTEERLAWEQTRVLTENEKRRIRWMAGLSVGAGVGDSWGGHTFFSVAVNAPMGAGFLQLVETYRKGCPHNGTWAAGRKHDHGSVFCQCGWFERGYKKVKLPRGWQ